MAYLSNIPQPTDQLSSSQTQILANFTAIGTILNPDSGAVNLVQQLADPALPATTISLNSKALPGAPIPAIAAVPEGGPEIYINRTDGVNTFHLPITASECSAVAGYAYLPSGVILKWGRATATHNADSSTAYAAGNDIPVFAAVLSVQLTLLNGIGNNSSIYWMTGTSTVTDLHVFLWNGGAINQDYAYLAIGY